MDKRTFWATKSPLPEFHTVTFKHAAFETIRLVAQQHAPVTLGGFSHRPCPMTIKPPDQAGETAKLQIGFHRAVVGREFKQKLRLVQLSGSRDPVEVTYAIYLDDLATPAKRWELYLADQGGVSFNADSVQVSATIDNPMRRAVAPIYDPSVFTGLELIG